MRLLIIQPLLLLWKVAGSVTGQAKMPTGGRRREKDSVLTSQEDGDSSLQRKDPTKEYNGRDTKRSASKMCVEYERLLRGQALLWQRELWVMPKAEVSIRRAIPSSGLVRICEKLCFGD